MHDRAKFRSDRANRCQDMAAGRHPGFLNLEILTAGSARRGQYASSCQVSCRSVKPLWKYSNFLIFKDGGHFASVLHLFVPPTKSIWWSLSLCKIWLESVEQFRRYVSVNILYIRLENAYSLPSLGRFWVKWEKQKQNFLQFCPSRNAISWDCHPTNQTPHKIHFPVSSWDTSKNWCHKKLTSSSAVADKPA